MRVTVIAFASDRVMFYATPALAESLVGRMHAKWVDDRHTAIRLTALARAVSGEYHPSRTRISSGGVLAAIGMSQVYTSNGERGKVDGHKFIDSIDQGHFVPRKSPGKFVYTCTQCGNPPDT